jgi:glycosyltransferase involved in cell wall biosynthesis
VYAQYGEADVSLFPSRWENWGIVASEAMLAGCAVVGTCNGGMKELIKPPLYGLVEDPEKSDRFADQVVRLVSDNNLRNRIVHAARQMVKSELSPEHIASLKVEAYRKAGAKE